MTGDISLILLCISLALKVNAVDHVQHVLNSVLKSFLNYPDEKMCHSKFRQELPCRLQ